MSNQNPYISIFMAVYNNEQFLPAALDSALAQRWTSFELIIVDDGSTDGGGAICDQYAAKDSRIRVMHIPNGGLFPAINKGLDLAKGEFLAYLDSDDYLEPDAYEHLAQAQMNLNADVVDSLIRPVYVPGEPKTITDLFSSPEKGILYIEDDASGKPQVHFSGSLATKLIRIDLLRQHGMRLDERYLCGSDSLFTIQLSKIVKQYRFIDRVTYNWRRQTQNSLTTTYSPTKLRRSRENLIFLDHLRQALAESYPAVRVDAALGDMYVNHAIRYLVACGADSLAGKEKEAYENFLQIFTSDRFLHSLPYYNPGKDKGKSRLLPILARLRLPSLAFALCKRKAAKRYQRELAALDNVK